MAVYRAALVWILRGAALAVVAFATWSFVEMRQTVAAALDPAEAASYSAPASMYFVPAGAIALLCLTLAEILSLLSKQRL